MWLHPWLFPPASLGSCFMLENRYRIGGKINSFFRLTETGFKTTSALRRPHASLNHHKHSQDRPSSALRQQQAGPQEVKHSKKAGSQVLCWDQKGGKRQIHPQMQFLLLGCKSKLNRQGCRRWHQKAAKEGTRSTSSPQRSQRLRVWW